MVCSSHAVRTLGSAMLASLFALPGIASAYTQAMHGSVMAYAYGGSLGTASGDTQVDSGPATVSAHAGDPWWCSTPGCSVSLGPQAGSGWGSVAADAHSGTISTRVGVFNATNSTVQWTISVPWGSGTILYVPGYWGEALTEAYLRTSWRIVATDPALQTGDPVQLAATFALSGTVDEGGRTSVSGGLLLNTAEAAGAAWLSSRETLDVHTFLEAVAVDPAVGSLVFATGGGGTIDHSETLVRSFAVGDVVLLETLLRTSAAIPNQGISGEVWVELGDTLQGSVVPLTAGVVLVPVPEADTWVMLAVGIALSAARAHRNRTRGSFTP